MTEREKLKLAAKACGLTVSGTVNQTIAQPSQSKVGGLVVANSRGGDSAWHPGNDEADSDRMAAQPLIDSTWYPNCVVACVAGDRHLVESGHRVDHNNTTEDKCRAVREARMLVAVEIGRALK